MLGVLVVEIIFGVSKDVRYNTCSLLYELACKLAGVSMYKYNFLILFCNVLFVTLRNLTIHILYISTICLLRRPQSFKTLALWDQNYSEPNLPPLGPRNHR